MNISDNQKAKIQKAFVTAHAGREQPSANAAWQADVMRALRRTALTESSSGITLFMNRHLWQLVPAACALILVLSVILVNLDVSLDYELAQGFMADPVAFRAEQFWGI